MSENKIVKRRLASNKQANNKNNKARNARTPEQMSKDVTKPYRGPVRVTNQRRLNKLILDTHYLRCKLDPFNAMGGSKMPAGGIGKTIVVDHRMAIDVSATSGQFWAKVVPVLPCPLWLKSGSPSGALTINGVVCETTSTVGASTFSRWRPGGIFSEFSTWLANSNSEINTLYGATQMRIVSQAWKIYYSGTYVNASGMVVASPSSFTVDDDTVGSRIEKFTATSIDNSNTNVVATNNPALATALITTDFVGNNLVQGSMQCRPEVGCMGLLKQGDISGKFKPMYSTPRLMIGPLLSSTDVATTNINSLVDGFPIGVTNPFGPSYAAAIDTSYSSTDLLVTGTTNNNNFRIEVITCVEYVLPPTSTIGRLASDCKPLDISSLQVANAVIAEAPVMMPNSEESSLFDKAVKFGAGLLKKGADMALSIGLKALLL